MTMSDNVSHWKRYLSLRFLASKVREKGVVWCLKAGVGKVRRFLVMVLAAPVVLVVRALRPVIVIRFGKFHSGRIGHFSMNTELYLCKLEADKDMQRTIDIFYYGEGAVCNQQLKRMWERTLHVCRFARVLDRLNRSLPGGANHVAPMPVSPGYPSPVKDIYSLMIDEGLLHRTGPHLSFTPEEERRGGKELQKLSILEDHPFICFITRGSAYPVSNKMLTSYRNASIHDYVPAAEEMVRRGYFAIRMGATVEEPLTISNQRILDYATENRTEFLDICLSAKCQFMISGMTGLGMVSWVFRRPVVWVNTIRFEAAAMYDSKHLFIPKKLWLREKGRSMTFKEILDTGVARFDNIRETGIWEEYDQYDQFGIDVVDNTPEEIKAVVVEMDERLKGTWQTTEEDEELQQRFWEIFESADLSGKISPQYERKKPWSQLEPSFLPGRIGAEFLRQNRGLLDDGKDSSFVSQ